MREKAEILNIPLHQLGGPELPIVFWYSDILENETGKVNGCFFKSMSKVREGNTISLNAETIGCGGQSCRPCEHR